MVTSVMQVVGVCTDSHVTVRTMLMNSASLKVVVLTITGITKSLKDIKFLIICNRDGDFSRAFAVLKLSGNNFGAARAVFCNVTVAFLFLLLSQVAVLDPEKKLVYLRLHNERTRARFLLVLQSTIMFSLFLRRRDSFLHLVSKLQGNTSSAKKPASFVSNTISFVSSDVARKNDVVENGSAKKEENT